ncbi:MAG: sugar ABC transporter ATP-binding protein [Verrucomicrobiota bacterium]
MSTAQRQTRPPTPALPLVRMSGITKSFGGQPVLQEVQFEIRAGEVHVLAGENGAGKSTLIRILAGIYTDFEGRLEMDGLEIRPRTPLEATALGVAVIHQELSLIGPLSVAENICLGRTPSRAGWVRTERQEAEALRLTRELGLDVDVRRPVEEFPIAIQQQIEIAKALSQNARVVVMDEPTSALNAPQVDKLFAIIESLKARGCGVVYITHKLEEIDRIADRITVIRDGRWIGTAPARELPRARFIEWMVGRELGEQFPRHTSRPGAERLRLERFSVPPAVREVSLQVRAGEIVGLAGLQGSGATELLLGLFGACGGAAGGSARLDGKEIAFETPRDAIESGVALLTNDRKGTGLVLPMSIVANSTLAGLRGLSDWGWRRPARERAAAEQIAGLLRLRAASLDAPVATLSGGNQQKVALAKCLQTRPRLLLLDEPTRGIDVAAKHEIYEQMGRWTAEGIAILLITSEMPELLNLSDRIVVLHRGRVTAEFGRGEASQEAILAAAMGQAAAHSGN